MSRLNKEEQEILDALEAGELQRVADVDETKERHQQYAEAIKYVEGRLQEER